MTRLMKKNEIYRLLMSCIVLMIIAVWMPGVVWGEETGLVSTEMPTLDSKGRKDPFKPFIDTATTVKKQQAKGAPPLSPLQKQDISSFNLVGISGSDQSGWRAIVEDSEKKFYPIVEGTLIGLEEGRVSSIKPDRVIVAVKPVDQRGKINYITILLHKDTEGTP
jgi:hypothetical protein